MEINDAVGAWTRRRSKVDLARQLGGRLPFGPVNDARDIFHDPHVAARKMIADVPHADERKKGWRVAANPIRFGLTPAVALSTPPRLGQHNGMLPAIHIQPAT
jgi:crotonobetainyl-CoA:carnitine CoA-transferase CaiB-like acyl-CoA transferase